MAYVAPTTRADGYVVPASEWNQNTIDNVLPWEEGSWTPSIGGSGGQSGQAYTIQVGRYIKIGRLVHAQFYITLSTLGTVTTNAQIKDLPYAGRNTTNVYGGVAFAQWSGLTTSVVGVQGEIAPGATAITLKMVTVAATSTTNMAQADLSNVSGFIGSITYLSEA